MHFAPVAFAAGGQKQKSVLKDCAAPLRHVPALGGKKRKSVLKRCAARPRHLQALGGKSILPVVYKQLPHLLADPDWRKRHAGLVTLSQIAEGCAKVGAWDFSKPCPLP